MENKLHTKKDAEYCLWYFKKHMWPDAKLIGSLGRGCSESKNDIDIYIPDYVESKPITIRSGMRKVKMKNKILTLLDAHSYESTDWGGYFLHNTIFGNIDVFFDIKNFDY